MLQASPSHVSAVSRLPRWRRNSITIKRSPHNCSSLHRRSQGSFFRAAITAHDLSERLQQGRHLGGPNGEARAGRLPARYRKLARIVPGMERADVWPSRQEWPETPLQASPSRLSAAAADPRPSPSPNPALPRAMRERGAKHGPPTTPNTGRAVDRTAYVESGK